MTTYYRSEDRMLAQHARARAAPKKPRKRSTKKPDAVQLHLVVPGVQLALFVVDEQPPEPEDR